MSDRSGDRLDRGDEEMEGFARLEEQIKAGFAESDRRFTKFETQIAEMDKRLGRVEVQIAADRKETNERFAEIRSEMREGFDRVDRRFERVDERFEALYRMLVAGGIVLLAAVIGALLT